MLNILPGRLQLNIVEPVGHDRCRVIFDYFYSEPESAGMEEIAKNDIEYSRKTLTFAKQFREGFALMPMKKVASQ